MMMTTLISSLIQYIEFSTKSKDRSGKANVILFSSCDLSLEADFVQLEVTLIIKSIISAWLKDWMPMFTVLR